MIQKTICMVVLAMFALANVVEAGITSRAVREAVEFTTRKFGKEVAEEGVEKLTSRISSLAAKHGDEVVSQAFRKVGPRAAKLVGEAGEQGDVLLRMLARYGDDGAALATRPGALKLISQYGDEGAEALLRHGTVGEAVIGQFAEGGVKALAKVSPQGGRRLAMMAQEGALKPEMLDVIYRHGDKACEFLWKNKGALMVGATLAAFVASPDEFIDGTTQLGSVVAENVVRPLAEVPKVMAEGLGSSLRAVLIVLGMAGIGMAVLLRDATSRRKFGKCLWYGFRVFTSLRHHQR